MTKAKRKARTLKSKKLDCKKVAETQSTALERFIANERREMQNAYLNDGSSNFKAEQVGQWIEIDEGEVLPRRKK